MQREMLFSASGSGCRAWEMATKPSSVASFARQGRPSQACEVSQLCMGHCSAQT